MQKRKLSRPNLTSPYSFLNFDTTTTLPHLSLIYSYAKLLDTHFANSVLQSLPEEQRALDDEVPFMPPMSAHYPSSFSHSLTPSTFTSASIKTRPHPTRVRARPTSMSSRTIARVSPFFLSHLLPIPLHFISPPLKEN